MLIDYVAVTYPSTTDPTNLMNLWGGTDEWIEMDRGARGYSKQWRCGHITLLSGGTEQMGIHVQASGQGCRELEAREHFPGWGTFLAWIDAARQSVARLDVAIDDRSGLLTLERLGQVLAEGHYVSRWKSWSDTRTVKRDRGQDREAGRCLRVGSRTSDAYLRVYDKGLEQGQSDSWVRAELELRDGRADLMVAQLAGSDDLRAVAGVLRGYLEIKQPGHHRNRSRWKSAEWWLEFLGQVGKLSLSMAPAVRTLDTVVAWLTRQVAPAVALVENVAGGRELLRALLWDGKARWSEWHKKLVSEQRRERLTRRVVRCGSVGIPRRVRLGLPS